MWISSLSVLDRMNLIAKILIAPAIEMFSLGLAKMSANERSTHSCHTRYYVNGSAIFPRQVREGEDTNFTLLHSIDGFEYYVNSYRHWCTLHAGCFLVSVFECALCSCDFLLHVPSIYLKTPISNVCLPTQVWNIHPVPYNCIFPIINS